MTGRKFLKNFSLFLDGNSYAGKVENLKPPSIALKTEEYRLGGMDAPLETEVGMEKLTLSFDLMDYNPIALAKVGEKVGLPQRFILRGALEDELLGAANTQSVEIIAVGKLAKADLGDWQSGQVAKISFESMALSYYQHSVSGKVVHLIDVNNMVRIINGFDQLAPTRAALGL